MGFLKFLKRDKSKEPDFGMEDAEGLDIPPPPPEPLEIGEQGAGGKEFAEFPELPELSEIDESFSEEEVPGLEPEKPLPELKFPSIGPEQAEKPDFTKYFEPVSKPDAKESFPRYFEPEVPNLKESADLPQLPRTMFGAKPLFGRPMPEWQKPASMPQTPAAELPRARREAMPYEKFERAAVREELAVLRHKGTKGPIFVRVERFSDILAGTKTIKNNLKIADHTVAKLNEIDYDREKLFDKWHNVMADLQKKIIFMDKTLFKR